MDTCGASEQWAGVIYLTHKPHIASILEIQNLPSGVGDIELKYQKQPTINCRITIRRSNACHDRNAPIAE